MISAYFAEKGLVRQQLDSFDEFIQNTMQELVDDSGELHVEPEAQYLPGQKSLHRNKFTVVFNQVYVSKPTATERDGTCLLYTSPSPRDLSTSRMPSSA